MSLLERFRQKTNGTQVLPAQRSSGEKPVVIPANNPNALDRRDRAYTPQQGPIGGGLVVNTTALLKLMGPEGRQQIGDIAREALEFRLARAREVNDEQHMTHLLTLAHRVLQLTNTPTFHEYMKLHGSKDEKGNPKSLSVTEAADIIIDEFVPAAARLIAAPSIASEQADSLVSSAVAANEYALKGQLTDLQHKLDLQKIAAEEEEELARIGKEGSLAKTRVDNADIIREEMTVNARRATKPGLYMGALISGLGEGLSAAVVGPIRGIVVEYRAFTQREPVAALVSFGGISGGVLGYAFGALEPVPAIAVAGVSVLAAGVASELGGRVNKWWEDRNTSSGGNNNPPNNP